MYAASSPLLHGESAQPLRQQWQQNRVRTVKTTLFINPKSDHEFVAEMRQACEESRDRYPSTRGEFSFRGETWNETVNGFSFSLPRSIRTIPLLLQGVPLHLIELEDVVEDPRGTKMLTEGIYEVGEIRAEVDSHMKSNGATGLTRRSYLCYTIKIEGENLGAINALYTAIRQGQADPTQVWDLVPPGR